ALRASTNIDPQLFLSVNFSPSAVLGGFARDCLRGVNRKLIIELTEHAPIDDYPAVRRALTEMPGVDLAVDDAGAGYTSLRHILELKPKYVKLDISIVHNIDTDEARQAMAAGIMHFASHDGTVVIAEGIETEDEAKKLQGLGVKLGRGLILGQGYYFAKPAPLE
ncbi:MAG: EAL domain-containing protein, partial [Acidimicrobiaceae bacterium]|nr:EAL domain-containing protein [Acidimicrobiaceae bacterium]